MLVRIIAVRTTVASDARILVRIVGRMLVRLLGRPAGMTVCDIVLPLLAPLEDHLGVGSRRGSA
jgi:hypothetical protein